MLIALITDQHLDFKKGEPKYYNYFMQFYNNIFFPYLKENNIDTIIDLGDTFDNRRTLDIKNVEDIKRDFFDVIQKENYNLHMIVGNHDIYYRQSNIVNTPKVLLSDYSKFKVYDTIQDVNFDGLNVTFCPWINNENKDETVKHLKNTDAKILFGHLELNGFELHRGYLMQDAEFDSSLFTGYTSVYSGHYHHKSSKGNIHYLGNPYQITWNDCNDVRGFHIFDTETLEIEFIQNPYNLFEKIYYNENNSIYENFNFNLYREKFVKVIVEERDKTNTEKFDSFLANLESAYPHQVRVFDTEEYESISMESQDNVLTTMFEYVTNNYSLDPKKVKIQLNTIYQETYYH